MPDLMHSIICNAFNLCLCNVTNFFHFVSICVILDVFRKYTFIFKDVFVKKYETNVLFLELIKLAAHGRNDRWACSLMTRRPVAWKRFVCLFDYILAYVCKFSQLNSVAKRHCKFYAVVFSVKGSLYLQLMTRLKMQIFEVKKKFLFNRK